jgi:transcriptional regulator with XRE-family HTH domain
MIAAKPNVVRILAAMNRAGWGVRDTCVNCGMNNRTLAKILNGEVPRRLDSLYRLCDGLKIPISDALINGTMAQPKLTLLKKDCA